MKFKKTGTKILFVIGLLLLNMLQLKAQGVPCGDPDVDCPIDGPVIIFAVAILFLSVKKMISIYSKVEIENKNG